MGSWAARRVVAFAAVAWSLALTAPAPADRREAPREKISVEELRRLAAERADRVEVGWSPKSALTTSALTWTSLGPTPISGEYWSGYANAAGRVSCVAVHPTHPAIVYLAAAQGGVWKTTNGGNSWTPLTDRLSSLASGWIAIQASNPNILYYGTGEQHYSGDSFYGDGLFRSVDAGAVWTKIASRVEVGSYIARVLVDPAIATRLFVASDIGVVRSEDGGDNWEIVLPPTNADAWANDLVFSPSSSEVLYAGLFGDGIYKSTDGGDTWGLLGSVLPAPGTFYRVNLAIAPSNAQVLYASFVDLDDNLLGLYRTVDGGANWTKLASTPNYMVGQGSYDNCMIVHPNNPDVFYAGGVFPYDPGGGDAGVIKTTDGGATWDDITIAVDGSQVHPDQQAMAFGPDGALWLANDGGVWKTIDGGASWINRNTNLSITQFYKFGLHPDDPSQLIAGTQDNGTLLYTGGPVWPQLIGGDGGPSGYDPYDPQVSYSSYIFMWFLYRWNAYTFDADVTGPWQALGDRASFGNGPLTFDPHRRGTLLAGTYRVWRSHDNGASWAAISNDLTDGGVLRAIAVAPGVPDAYYASSTDGVVHFTSDGGLNWHRRSAGLPVAFLPDVVVGPNNALTAYTCARTPSGNRVFKTVDAGVTWTSITGDLPGNLSPHSLAVDFRPSPDKIFLGTDYGLWVSADGGTTWSEEGGAFPRCAVFDLQIDLANDYVVAATHGRGMWRAALGIGAVSVAQGESGEALALGAPWPNPTRVPATLRFDLPQAAVARLEIFDLGGRRVRTLLAGPRPAGSQRLAWDGNDDGGVRVPPGIYHIRLEAEGRNVTRRLVVIR